MFLYSYKCHGHYYMEILCFKVRKSEVKIVGHRKKIVKNSQHIFCKRMQIFINNVECSEL